MMSNIMPPHRPDHGLAIYGSSDDHPQNPLGIHLGKPYPPKTIHVPGSGKNGSTT